MLTHATATASHFIHKFHSTEGVRTLTIGGGGSGLLLVGQQWSQHGRVLHQDGVGSLNVDRVRRLPVHW